MTNIDSLLVAAGKAMTQRRLADAESGYRSVLEIDAHNQDGLNGLGIALQEQGNLPEAERLFVQVVAHYPDSICGHFNLGQLRLEQAQYKAALDCFEQVLRRNPGEADTLAALGIALERMGKFDDAIEYFEEAAQFSNSYAVARILRFKGDFLAVLDRHRDSGEIPEVIYASGPAQDMDTVILVTCDPVYLRKYGPAFINSFARWSGRGTLLHVHLLCPDGTAEAEARKLLKAAGASNFRVSVEVNTRYPAGSREQAVWFTCARFLHLKRWLADYKVPILLLDIDAVLDANPRSLVEETIDSDLGLYLRNPRRSPWLDISGNALLARPTPAAMDYLRLVGNYIRSFADANSLVWHLDQCALYCTLRMLELDSRSPKVKSIGDIVTQAVFHVGHAYDLSMANQRYSQYAADP